MVSVDQYMGLVIIHDNIDLEAILVIINLQFVKIDSILKSLVKPLILLGLLML